MAKAESERERKLRESIERRKARLALDEAALKKIAQRKTKAERALETRRRIIIGAALLDSKLPEDFAIVERIKATLLQRQDREAFGLPTELF